MPTYQYACPDCGAEFEKVQKFADKPLKKCPKCGKAKVHRVVSRVAVSFKGSGFYVNDSKSSSSTSAASTKPEKAEATAGTTETKAEPAAESKASDATSSAKAESKPAESKKTKKKDAD